MCRKKWFGYHYKSLWEIVSKWPTVYFLTLTIRNIPDDDFGKGQVRRIRTYFTRLRKAYPQIKGGFYVVQATNSGNGWHLHLHVLYDGSFIPQSELSKTWDRVSCGSRIVYVEKARDPKTGLRYLLSDFSGAPRIRAGDVYLYNAVFKSSRLVQPFGKYRAVKLRVPFKCPNCGSTSWDLLENIIQAPRRWRHFPDFDEGP